MKWNKHPNIGDHALLSPSAHYWINYTDDRLLDYILALQAKEMGTRLHELAAELISLERRQKEVKDTFNMYVNDGIGFGMSPEVTLFYSKYIYGTADTICYDGQTLRIHDLKTGKIQGAMDQLRIYAALFCLEYNVDPETIKIELRIYQANEKIVEKADPAQIRTYMDRIVAFDKVISERMDEYA